MKHELIHRADALAYAADRIASSADTVDPLAVYRLAMIVRELCDLVLDVTHDAMEDEP